MSVKLRTPQGAVVDVAEDSVDRYTASGWSRVETAKKQAGDKPAGDGKAGRAKSSE